MDIKSAFANTEGLIHDDAEARIVGKLAELQQRLIDTENPRNSIRTLFRRRKLRPPVRGIYLWGGVGRGKTFLMDLFYESLEVKSKKRIHFHRMMSEVHERLHRAGSTEDPLDSVAELMSNEARVLCFDEFFVSDIGDAMILGRLLEGLFRRGLTLVTTSNSHPSNLYRDGLQRDRFLPAISLLETYTDVMQLDGGVDYRLRLLQKAGTFFSNIEANDTRQTSLCFQQIASGEIQEAGSIDILGRPIPAIRSAKGAVWFDFEGICGGPRSQQDYIEIARSYQTVIISTIPILSGELDDQARRFIALVDEFYDRRVKLVLSSAAGVDSLYQGKRLKFEFERTKSRLVEMQSRKYLHSAHLS